MRRSRQSKWRAADDALDDYILVSLEFQLLHIAGAMYGGGGRQANLEGACQRGGAFRMSNVASSSSYISYLEVLRTKNVEWDSHQWSARKMIFG